MTRKTTLIAIGIAACLVAAGGAYVWLGEGRRTPAVASVARTADQNVLLITIDTLRGDALGSYGGRAATPHLDALAAAGTRFTFAHAHAVVTLPSHTSILTGRYPFDHGVRENTGYRVAASIDTLAEMAQGAGLATGAFVGAFPLDRRFGLDQGFDAYDDVGPVGAQEDFAMAERRAETVVAAARAWIAAQQSAGRPWFAWVHVFDPHAGYTPPPPFHQQYANDLYAGEVAYTDHALGPLLADAGASSRPTTVVVTADHGEGLGEHGEVTHGTFAYEATLRVPLIVAQLRGQGSEGALSLSPSRSPSGPGAIVDTPASHVDIVPTVRDALALDRVAGLPGRSLLDHAATAERVSYFEAMTPMLTHGWAPLSGVISGRTKYIDLPIEEVYDLAADPREQNNLAGASVAETRVLQQLLAGFKAPLPGAQVEENADARRRLESLGYVSRSAPRKATFTEDDDPKRLIRLHRMILDGMEHYAAGRGGEAIATLREVIAARPDMRLPYRHVALVQWEQGDAAGAIATMREAVAKAGPDVDLDVRLATYLAESGSARESLPMLERAVAAYPGHTEALNALGIAYARLGRATDALETFTRVLTIDPRDLLAHENIGTVHLGSGDMRKAAAAFTRALELSPQSSRAQAGLAVAALNEGRHDEAIARWKRAVELDPRNFDAMFNVATELLNAGRRAEARPYLEAFVRTAPRGRYGPDIERLRMLLR